MLRLTLAVACIFSACCKPPAHVKVTEQSMKQFCHNVAQEKHLRVLGCGGFYEGHKVLGFYADFESPREYTKEDAKTLLLELVQQCTDHISFAPQLEPHLATLPISKKTISLSIGFVDSDRNPYSELAQIHIHEDNVYFSQYDVQKKTYVCIQSEKIEEIHNSG